MLLNWNPTFDKGDLKKDVEHNFLSLSSYVRNWSNKVDSKNVKRLNTDITEIKSDDGTTIIEGPLLTMYDSTPTLRLRMGLDRNSGNFLYTMYNDSGVVTVEIDSNGNLILKGIVEIGSGNTIVKIDSNGIYAGHATFGSAPFRVTPTGILTLSGASSSLSVGTGNNIAKIDSNGIYCGNSIFASAPFRVSYTGVMTLTGASSSLSVGTGNNIVKMDSNGIYAGNSTFASAPFRVSFAGVLNATSATIKGTVTGSTFDTNDTGTDTNYFQIDDNGFNSYWYNGSSYVRDGMNIVGTWNDTEWYYHGYEYFGIWYSAPGCQLMSFDTSHNAYTAMTLYNGNTYAANAWDFSGATGITGLYTDTQGDHSHTVTVGGTPYTTSTDGAHDHTVTL